MGAPQNSCLDHLTASVCSSKFTAEVGTMSRNVNNARDAVHFWKYLINYFQNTA